MAGVWQLEESTDKWQLEEDTSRWLREEGDVPLVVMAPYLSIEERP